jgi:hypothetical protein
MTCARQNARVQSVDTVDTLDVRFKSLYPFCLFFKQVGFSFNNFYYPQYPQSTSPLCSAWFAAWVKPPFFRYPPRIHNIHKPALAPNVWQKNYSYILLRISLRCLAQTLYLCKEMLYTESLSN